MAVICTTQLELLTQWGERLIIQIPPPEPHLQLTQDPTIGRVSDALTIIAIAFTYRNAATRSIVRMSVTRLRKRIGGNCVSLESCPRNNVAPYAYFTLRKGHMAFNQRRGPAVEALVGFKSECRQSSGICESGQPPLLERAIVSSYVEMM